MKKYDKQGFELLPHSPHSLDLTPYTSRQFSSDYFLTNAKSKSFSMTTIIDTKLERCKSFGFPFYKMNWNCHFLNHCLVSIDISNFYFLRQTYHKDTSRTKRNRGNSRIEQKSVKETQKLFVKHKELKLNPSSVSVSQSVISRLGGYGYKVHYGHVQYFPSKRSKSKKRIF